MSSQTCTLEGQDYKVIKILTRAFRELQIHEEIGTPAHALQDRQDLQVWRKHTILPSTSVTQSSAELILGTPFRIGNILEATIISNLHMNE